MRLVDVLADGASCCTYITRVYSSDYDVAAAVCAMWEGEGKEC